MAHIYAGESGSQGACTRLRGGRPQVCRRERSTPAMPLMRPVRRVRSPRHAAAAALVSLAASILSPAPVSAQMMLPGANNGVAVDRPPRETGTPADTGVHPIIVKPPSEASVIGHVLSRDGHAGKMAFEKKGGDLVLTKLQMMGDKISKPQETCSVEVSLSAPLVVLPAGRPHGLVRYDVPLDACPFSFDVLEGAVLVSRPDPTCDFTAADCRITPGGLWGPTPFELPPSRATELEHQRVKIETTMRTNFRALLKKFAKDKAAAKALVRDQAAFSSQREMTCRDYEQEPVHGFCSTQITEARTLELLAQFGLAEEPREQRHPLHGEAPANSPTHNSTASPGMTAGARTAPASTPQTSTPETSAPQTQPAKAAPQAAPAKAEPAAGPSDPKVPSVPTAPVVAIPSAPPLRLHDAPDPGTSEKALPPIH